MAISPSWMQVRRVSNLDLGLRQFACGNGIMTYGLQVMGLMEDRAAPPTSLLLIAFSAFGQPLS